MPTSGVQTGSRRTARDRCGRILCAAAVPPGGRGELDDPDFPRSGMPPVLCKGMQVMLVLSRKENEEVAIAENVSIKILGVFGNKVRLGISAPNFITIRRR